MAQILIHVLLLDTKCLSEHFIRQVTRFTMFRIYLNCNILEIPNIFQVQLLNKDILLNGQQQYLYAGLNFNSYHYNTRILVP